MQKRLLTFLISILIVVLALPISAQEDDGWFAYLLDTVDYQLLRVNNDGSTAEYAVPVPENGYFNTTEAGFGADGRFMSFCAAVQENPLASGPAYTAHVVDIVSNTVLRTFPLGGVNNCVANQFGADSTLLGVGLMNRFPGDPNADLSLPMWELHVYNIVSGELVAALDSNNPITSEVTLFGGPGGSEEQPIVPRSIEVSETEVVFMAFPGVGMGGPPELNVYRWDIAANMIEALPRRGIIGSDYLDTTGEVVVPATDSNLPTVDPGGPLPPHNTVNLTNGDETRMVYQNDAQIVTSTTFVNDDEAIAITLLDPFDANELFQHSGLTVIDRDGNVLQAVREFQGYLQPFAAPGGYLLMYDIPHEQNPPTFVLEYQGKDGSSRELWNYSPDDSGTFWQLIYVSE